MRTGRRDDKAAEMRKKNRRVKRLRKKRTRKKGKKHTQKKSLIKESRKRKRKIRKGSKEIEIDCLCFENVAKGRAYENQNPRVSDVNFFVDEVYRVKIRGEIATLGGSKRGLG